MQDLPPFEIGQHHVKNQEVIVARHCKMSAVQAIAGKVHNKAGFRQPLLQIFAGLGFVFDNKELHVCLFITYGARKVRPVSCSVHGAAWLLTNLTNM